MIIASAGPPEVVIFRSWLVGFKIGFHCQSVPAGHVMSGEALSGRIDPDQ
jgi:hypothetical protein